MPMFNLGRLFWKIFAFFLVCFTFSAIVISSFFWQQNKLEYSEFCLKLPVLEHDLSRIKSYLEMHEPSQLTHSDINHLGINHPAHPILIINEQQQDLLQRNVPHRLIKAAQNEIAQAQNATNCVWEITTPSKQTLLAFAPNYPMLFEKTHYLITTKLPVIRLITLIVVGLFFSSLLALYITKPIQKLKQATKVLEHENRSSKLAQSMGNRQDELKELAEDFDHMSDKIQTLLIHQQNIFKHTSHELRTPLTRLRLTIGQLYQSNSYDEALLTRAEKEIQRLDTLIGEILMLSKLESDIAIPAFDYFDITGLIRAITEESQLEAKKAHVDILMTLSQSFMFTGSMELIRRAIENILRNAIAHSPTHSAIHISINVADDRLLITIKDQGSGVDEESIHHLFEPFFRSKNSSSKGHGLGLTIAKKAIEFHSGTIKVVPNNPTGLIIQINLPINS